MRMDGNSGELTAADVVNNLSVAELADIIETVNYLF
jgi:16S rRNA C1402 N4-methylase RsmH